MPSLFILGLGQTVLA